MDLKEKKKLVFVTSRFPLPLEGGFEIKNFQLLKQLHKYFEISAHFILTKHPSVNEIEKIQNFCQVNIYKTNILVALFRGFINLFTYRPLQNGLFFSIKANKALKKDLRDSDLAICSVFRTAEYILNFEGPKIFDLADSKAFIYKRNISSSNGILKLLFMLEAGRLLKLEKDILAKGGKILLFNKIEAKFLGSKEDVYVVPHGVNRKTFQSKTYDHKYGDGLSFIGKLNVPHNIEMIEWFIANVFPFLPKEIKIYLMGSKPHKRLIQLANSDKRIKLLGFVDNPEIILKSSIASICPLQSGGGIQNKVIQSIASGALTIASSRATSQFQPLKKSGVIECNGPQDWVRQIIDIINFPERYELNRELGISYARKNFSWEAYGHEVRKIIDSQLRREAKQ